MTYLLGVTRTNRPPARSRSRSRLAGGVLSSADSRRNPGQRAACVFRKLVRISSGCLWAHISAQTGVLELPASQTGSGKKSDVHVYPTNVRIQHTGNHFLADIELLNELSDGDV